MHRLRRFLAYPLAQKLLLAEAAARLAVFSVLVKVVPSRQISRTLMAYPAVRSDARLQSQRFHSHSEEEICWAVRTAARYIPGATCLPQALVGTAMLRRAGYAAEIRIGVARLTTEFLAHAWVMSAGKVVLGESNLPFAEFPGR